MEITEIWQIATVERLSVLNQADSVVTSSMFLFGKLTGWSDVLCNVYLK